jgi:hypothetical protein
MEELVEPKIIGPIGIEIEFVNAAIACSAPIITAGKDVLEAVLELFGNVAEVHVFSRSLGTLNSEGIAVEHIEAQEGLDKQEVDAKPDGLESLD